VCLKNPKKKKRAPHPKRSRRAGGKQIRGEKKMGRGKGDRLLSPEVRVAWVGSDRTYQKKKRKVKTQPVKKERGKRGPIQ